MDVRTFVVLEQQLFRRLRKDWLTRSTPLLTEIERLTNEGQYDQARKAVQDLSLKDTGKANQQFIRYMLQAFVSFGARSVTGQPTVLLRHETAQFVDQSTATFLMYLEHGGTTDLQDRAVQLIAQAERSVVQKAERFVKPFVSFARAGEDNLELISSLHSSRMATWGFTAEAEVLEITRYRLNAILDGRTSEFCRLIHGKEFEVTDARTKIVEVLSAQNPEDLKTIQPWPKQNRASLEQISKMTEKELVGAGWHIPPFHPGCRTLLVQAGKESRLVRPVPEAPDIPAETTTQEAFAEMGLEFTPQQVGHWNAYMGISPVKWLEKLSGAEAHKIVQGVFGKNALGVRANGDIVSRIRGVNGGVKYAAGTSYDPYTGKLYLTHADLLVGDPKAEAKFLKTMIGSVVDAGVAVGSASLAISVGSYATEFAKMGFLPSAVQWQQIRLELIDRLMDGDLKKLLASLTDDQQQFLLNVLNNHDQQAMSVLADLPWEYRGKSVASLLFDGIAGEFSLDMTNPEFLKKAKAHL